MNYDNISDILVGLMTIYLCIGIVVGASMLIYFIYKDVIDREKFARCFEAILCYGPAFLVLVYLRLKKLVKFLATRDYRAWYERHRDNIREWRRARKRLKRQIKDFKTKKK